MQPTTQPAPEVLDAIRRDLLAMLVGDNALQIGGIHVFVVRHGRDRWSVMSSWHLDSVPLEEAVQEIIEESRL